MDTDTLNITNVVQDERFEDYRDFEAELEQLQLENAYNIY